MFYELRFGDERNFTVLTFFKSYFATKSNKVTCNAFIKFLSALVELCTFNKRHENVVVLVSKTNESVNNCRIVNCSQFVDFVCRVFEFFVPVKTPFKFFNLHTVLRKKSCDFSFKNLSRQRILNGVRQLVNLKIKFYFFSFFHLSKIRNCRLKTVD